MTVEYCHVTDGCPFRAVLDPDTVGRGHHLSGRGRDPRGGDPHDNRHHQYIAQLCECHPAPTPAAAAPAGTGREAD